MQMYDCNSTVPWHPPRCIGAAQLQRTLQTCRWHLRWTACHLPWPYRWRGNQKDAHMDLTSVAHGMIPLLRFSCSDSAPARIGRAPSSANQTSLPAGYGWCPHGLIYRSMNPPDYVAVEGLVCQDVKPLQAALPLSMLTLGAALTHGSGTEDCGCEMATP